MIARGQVRTVALALALLAAGAWAMHHFVVDGQMAAPVPVERPVEGPATAASRFPGEAPPVATASVPREDVAGPGDASIPPPEEGAENPRVHFSNVPESLEVPGTSFHAALIETPGLFLRWGSADVRKAFLESKVKVPREATLPPGRSQGVPVATVLVPIREAGFFAEYTPAVLRISRAEKDPSPHPR